jgi:uncharacterized protein (DUF1786 family)
MMVHRQLQQATRRRQPVLLYGVTMGGGPSQWGAEAHLKADFPLYATPAAARSFNDDLEKVTQMGIRLVSDDEALQLPKDVLRLRLADFDFHAIARAFGMFGVSLADLDAVAVAVFDHGDAPPQESDRQFRFNYLDRRIRAENRLSAFAYRAEDVPAEMTRLQAVVASAQGVDAPLLVMDSAPAAVLGATYDPQVAAVQRKLIANVGNFHSLAFRLGPQGIEGVFEHHTGLVDLPRLEHLLRALADGSLTHGEVFEHHGHGALVYNPEALPLGQGAFDVAVTGPRRGLFKLPPMPGGLRPYLAVPFGDMMLAGCIGLLSAAADKMPELADPIRASLHQTGSAAAPWEFEA